tara:strand:+ start:1670 stop:2509 length:840 start_codon:yes stop_codon:yes gene_type:complete
MRRRDRISAAEALLLGRFHVLSNKPVLSSREQDEFANVKGSLSRAPSLELLNEAYLTTFGSTLDLSPAMGPSDDMVPMSMQPVERLPAMTPSDSMGMMAESVTGMSDSMMGLMGDREEVSVGGQTYMLPRDPVARDKFRKSLMQQQIEKDQKVASSAVFPGRMETVETMTNPAMFADMRGRPAYDVGYRMGLDATENTGMMTLDDVAGAGETAQKYRESLGSRSGTQRGSMSPRDIERLGYLEAMEAAEQKLMDEDRMYLQEGISFQPAADKIVVEEGL